MLFTLIQWVVGFSVPRYQKLSRLIQKLSAGPPEAQGTGVFEICSCQDDCVFESWHSQGDLKGTGGKFYFQLKKCQWIISVASMMHLACLQSWKLSDCWVLWWRQNKDDRDPAGQAVFSGFEQQRTEFGGLGEPRTSNLEPMHFAHVFW